MCVAFGAEHEQADDLTLLTVRCRSDRLLSRYTLTTMPPKLPELLFKVKHYVLDTNARHSQPQAIFRIQGQRGVDSDRSAGGAGSFQVGVHEPGHKRS